MKHKCDNCGAEYTDENLEEIIGDFWSRVTAGNIVPSGECRECGSLVYPQDGKVLLRRQNVEELASLCGYILETEYDSLMNYLENDADFLDDKTAEILFCGTKDEINNRVNALCVDDENTHIYALAYRLHYALPEEERA